MICDKCGTAYCGHWSMPEIKCPRCKARKMSIKGIPCPNCGGPTIDDGWTPVFCSKCGDIDKYMTKSAIMTKLPTIGEQKFFKKRDNVSKEENTMNYPPTVVVSGQCSACKAPHVLTTKGFICPNEVCPYGKISGVSMKDAIHETMNREEEATGSQEFAPVDLINHPPHYTSHPSGVECITIVEHLNFNIGNAIKYLWRAGLKSPDTISDLKKAVWYVNREIERLSHVDTQTTPR